MHIGLLEDNAVERELLCVQLQQGLHSYDAFGGSAAFLQALKHQRFDMVLIGWGLSDGSAADVLRWIRNNISGRLPSMVVTGDGDTAAVAAALEAGAIDCIVKPVKPVMLLACIQAAAQPVRPMGMPPQR